MHYAEKHAKCENFFSNLIVDPRYIKSGVASGLNARCAFNTLAHTTCATWWPLARTICRRSSPAAVATEKTPGCRTKESQTPVETLAVWSRSCRHHQQQQQQKDQEDLFITVVIILLVRRLVVVSSRVGSYLIASSAWVVSTTTWEWCLICDPRRRHRRCVLASRWEINRNFPACDLPFCLCSRC